MVGAFYFVRLKIWRCRTDEMCVFGKRVRGQLCAFLVMASVLGDGCTVCRKGMVGEQVGNDSNYTTPSIKKW